MRIIAKDGTTYINGKPIVTAYVPEAKSVGLILITCKHGISTVVLNALIWVGIWFTIITTCGALLRNCSVTDIVARNPATGGYDDYDNYHYHYRHDDYEDDRPRNWGDPRISD